MKHILRIKDILGCEVRTRMLIEKFAQTLNPEDDYLLDMDQVEFISRSATDELYNLLEERGHIILVNMSDMVQKMFDTVAIGRFNPRNLQIKDEPVTNCDDMESLSRCLKAI